MITVFGMSTIFFWLIVLVVMIGVEIITMGLTSIWFAGGIVSCTFCAPTGCRTCGISGPAVFYKTGCRQVFQQGTRPHKCRRYDRVPGYCCQ